MVTSLLTKIPIATDNLISNKIRPTGYVCPSMIKLRYSNAKDEAVSKMLMIGYIMGLVISANGRTVQSSKISRRDYGYNSSMSSVQIDQLC